MGNEASRGDASHGGAASGKPHGGAASHGADRQVTLELDIQKERMGKLIGTNGQTIKGIQQHVHTVKLLTPTKDDAASDEYKFVAVKIVGKAADVFKAAKMVHDVATACLAVLTSKIPPHFIPLLQTPSIQGLKQGIPVDNIILPRKQDKDPKVILEGYLEDVTRAYQFIIEEVVKADREQQKAKENQKLMALSQKRLGGDAAAAAAGADAAGAPGGGAGRGGGKQSKRGARGGSNWREAGEGAKKPANTAPAQNQTAAAGGE
jgi:hypothetical protein